MGGRHGSHMHGTAHVLHGWCKENRSSCRRSGYKFSCTSTAFDAGLAFECLILRVTQRFVSWVIFWDCWCFFHGQGVVKCFALFCVTLRYVTLRCVSLRSFGLEQTPNG